MARDSASVSKVICFTCRATTCGCVASHNPRAPDAAGELRPSHSQGLLALAWLGGACVAGTALGAAIALLLGG